jgi:hypothetical protein
MAGVEIEEDYLPDVMVDVSAGRAVGVNGINAMDCSVTGDNIELKVNTPFGWSRRPVAAFRRVPATRRYRVVLNGQSAGVYTSAELESGVALPAW